MSALPPKADIAGRHLDVRFVPQADIKARFVNGVGNAHIHRRCTVRGCAKEWWPCDDKSEERPLNLIHVKDLDQPIRIRFAQTSKHQPQI
jgi:hypothetical protein